MSPVAEITSYPFQQKIHESKAFADFSYDAFNKMPYWLVAVTYDTEFYKSISFVKRGYDTEFYDVKFYESIIFVKLY